jgi:hypothetical protein
VIGIGANGKTEPNQEAALPFHQQKSPKTGGIQTGAGKRNIATTRLNTGGAAFSF